MDTDKKDSIKIQYRGTPIIDTPGGVLLTAMENTKFILPGGAAKRTNGESRLEAAIRELREETHLNAYAVVELFEYIAPPYKEKNYQDYHKVFYVKARGTAKPGHEVKHIGYYKQGMDIVDGRQVSWIHKQIIEKYFEIRMNNPELFTELDDFYK